MSLFSKKNLGIDIGAASIKLVEISGSPDKRKLENYVEFKLPYNASSKTFYSDGAFLLDERVSDILQEILKKAKIKEKKAVFAIPDFSTFFTTFNLPPMTKEEVPQAIEFEARHHIPLPLEEVTFDWQIIDKQQVSPGVKLKVLLVAVPNKVLQGYQRLAALCDFDVKGMEAEVFGLIRSSVSFGKYWGPVCLIDIGFHSTTLSIVDKKMLQLSHSFDFSGAGLTKTLSQGLGISAKQAEELKRKHGLNSSKPETKEIVTKELNALSFEMQKIYQKFEKNSGKKITAIILTGGTASMSGLKQYFETSFKTHVDMVNPFVGLKYPPILEQRLIEMAPSFAVAVGAAMLGME